MAGVIVRKGSVGSPAVQALISALDAEITERYPEENANFFRLDADEVAQGRGAFLVATVDGEVVGCGAVRRLDGTDAEIKRMYVTPSSRGRGTGRALLAALEGEARSLGATRLVLETGKRLFEAVALYKRAGFTIIPPFNEYVGARLSLCMGKELR